MCAFLMYFNCYVRVCHCSIVLFIWYPLHGCDVHVASYILLQNSCAFPRVFVHVASETVCVRGIRLICLDPSFFVYV